MKKRKTNLQWVPSKHLKFGSYPAIEFRYKGWLPHIIGKHGFIYPQTRNSDFIVGLTSWKIKRNYQKLLKLFLK